MSFKLVYLSQQDPQWKNDLLGFGDPGDTIGYVGCALTATAMLLSGHGYAETPKTLNSKLKNVNGFVSAAIMWGAVSQIYPNVTLKAFIPCSISDAPLAQIDAAIAAGQPAIVQVDRSPASGIQTHWVVLYARKGDDYLMLDPWPYNPGTGKEDYLMQRYAQGRSLKRAISHVILYDAYGSSGPITPPTTPTTCTTTTSGDYARVKTEVTWGLNVRSSVDTSSMDNVVTSVTAGTQLLLLESDGLSKLGGINQWVRVRTPDGKEGFTAAWYLEKVITDSPAPTAPTPVTPPPPAPMPEPTTPSGSYARVKAEVTAGLNIRSSSNTSSLENVIAIAPAGSQLLLLDSNGVSKIGVMNQWVRVRTPDDKEGYTAAWFLEKVTAAAPTPAIEPAPSPSNEAPAPAPTSSTPAPSTPPTPPPAPSTPEPEKLILKVLSSVGSSGLRMRKYPSLGGALVVTLKANTRLVVVEPIEKAKKKIGKANQWIYVREPNGKRGYVSAQFVQKA